MKEEKKSFIVYCDIKEILDDLSDEEVGKLFRAMVDYSMTEEQPELDRLLKFVFTPIRQQMDRDKEKWDGVRNARSRAGKKGGEKSAQLRANNKKTLQEGQNPVTDFKQSQAKPSKRKQSQANQAVNVNVNDNVNVNVNDNVIQLVDDLLVPLGEAANTSYEQERDEVNQLVAMRLEEGYTEEDLKKVVEYQCEEIGKEDNPIEGNFLKTFSNPLLLFGDAFEGTLKNQKKYQEHKESMQRMNEIVERTGTE